jgi:ribosomal protein S18 acetylase RimI-like enzyme
MQLVVTDLERSDFPVIRDWIDPAVFEIFTRPITDEQLERLLTREKDGRLTDLGLKAVDGGSVVGLVHAVLNWENEYAHIQQILTKPGLERRGIGQVLMRETLEMLFEQHRFHRVQLFVDEENVAALTFYRKQGFEVDGFMRESRKLGHKFAGWRCLSILDREWRGMARL